MSSFITAIVGASPNEIRYSNIAVKRLNQYNFPVIALGFRKGQIGISSIVTDWPNKIPRLKVVSLYIGPERQPEFYKYIINLQPKIVIFNPGTENPEFYKLLEINGIGFEEACTLVLLTTGVYSDL